MDFLFPPLVLGHENIWQAGRGLDHDPADQTTHRHGLPGDWRLPLLLPPCVLACMALSCPVSTFVMCNAGGRLLGDELVGKT